MKARVYRLVELFLGVNDSGRTRIEPFEQDAERHTHDAVSGNALTPVGPPPAKNPGERFRGVTKVGVKRHGDPLVVVLRSLLIDVRLGFRQRLHLSFGPGKTRNSRSLLAKLERESRFSSLRGGGRLGRRGL